MPRQLALFICILFILWLFTRDRKLRPMTSMALWIPLLWLIIIGSRPVSLWFGLEGLHSIEKLEDYLEGSPADRNVFIALIIAGVFILIKRHINWNTFVNANRWFIVFIIYCGISCLWSDYLLTAFKRYIKEIGNVIMAIVIITETKPDVALKAVFSRYTCFVIPVSVLFIKYFPELGRYYNRWTWEVTYCGISTEKNSFGQIVFVCGIFIVWDLIQTFTADKRFVNFHDLLSQGILFAMVVWLLYMANSSTSIACMILGIGILFFMRRDFAQKVVNPGTCILILLCIFISFNSTTAFIQPIIEFLNRDVTLTGRTDIWRELLDQPINPLIGKGFQSFWLTPEAAKISQRFYFFLNQAHNGYLDVYLHMGTIGVFLFIVAIIVAVNNLKIMFVQGDHYTVLLFTFLIALLVYNLTEATINKLCIMWFIPMIALMYYPNLPQNIMQGANGDDIKT